MADAMAVIIIVSIASALAARWLALRLTPNV
jgi:hypothetical protein